MTEAEWVSCADPAPMLEFLRGRVSDRHLRLFPAGCCRRVRHLLPDDLLRDAEGRHAVEVAEQWADIPSEAGSFSAALGNVV